MKARTTQIRPDLSGSWGRRPLLAAGFGIEVIRGILLALILTQVLDAITSAIIGVLTVVIITDLTTGTGCFNLSRGTVTMFSTIAATISTSSSGFVLETLGHLATFLMFAGLAAATASMTWLMLPESKPGEYLD